MKVAPRLFCKPPEHEINHGEVYERLAGVSEYLVVFGKTPISIQPCEGSLDDPASRQKFESLDII